MPRPGTVGVGTRAANVSLRKSFRRSSWFHLPFPIGLATLAVLIALVASGLGSSAAATGGVVGSGVAVSGVHCGPGVRQVAWTQYAPLCVSAFHGSNGGATAPGVTGTTITIAFRIPSDFAAVQAEVSGPSATAEVHDYQVLVNYFNKQFELYGRHVVLKVYNGQGQELEEMAQEGQAAAQADAQTEKDMGVFADPTAASVVFASALASRGIIGMSVPYTSNAIYHQFSPYLIGTPEWPSDENWASATAAVVCQNMAGKKAIFAGDPAYKQSKRIFGLTEIDQPGYSEGGTALQADLESECGLTVAKVAKYQYNFTDEAQQAVSIVAEMKAAGVTTLIHAGDPFMFAQLTNAAKQQDWQPEWIGVDPTDTLAALLAAPSEMDNAFEVGPFGETPGANPSGEVGHVYRLASGGAPPDTGSYENGTALTGIYQVLLQLFDGIQAAGPRLTAQSWLKGEASIPTGSGAFGTWCSHQPYDPTCSFVVARWSSTQKNPNTGKAGAFITCDGGRSYPDTRARMGSGQLTGC